MTEELLTQLKEKVEYTKRTNAEHNEKIKRLLELEQNQNVREYINLNALLGKNRQLLEPTEKDIILSVYRDSILENKQIKTNEIYLCFGTFDGFKNANGEYYISSNVPYDKSILCRVYRNIEYGKDELIMPLNEGILFEKSHKVIFAKSNYFNAEEYYKVQSLFLSVALTEGQEESVKRILNYR